MGLGRARHRAGLHREVVVLAGDLDPAGGGALHGDVAAVMAERHLEGAAAQSQGEQLMAEADAEHRHPADERAQRPDRGSGHRGVSGAVAEEHSVGIGGQHLFGRSAGRHDGHGGDLAQALQDGGLDAQVVGHHPAGARSRCVGLRRGHLADQIDSVGARLGLGGGPQRGLVGGAERAGHGAGVADVAGEPAGVDPGDAGHAVEAQIGVERAGGAPAARAAGQVAHDHAPAAGPGRLAVGGVDAVVADVGIGEGDDLPGVGRIGHHLLVAAHHGVEHHLARGDVGGSSDGLPLEHLSVAQHEQARCGAAHRCGPARCGAAHRCGTARPGAAHRCGLPSITTGSEASRVWRTRPFRTRPS